MDRLLTVNEIREIKFRALSEGKIHQCLGISLNSMTALLDVEGMANASWCKVEKYLEYTGLKDDQGQEIYEGDIVELKAYEPGFGYIEWQGIVEFGNPNGGYDWGFQIKPIGDESVNPLILLWVETEMPNVTCVVIGNIYQNPELLEGENG